MFPEAGLVFDLLGRNAGLKCERNSGLFVHPKLHDPEKAVGLIIGEEVLSEQALNRWPLWENQTEV